MEKEIEILSNFINKKENIMEADEMKAMAKILIEIYQNTAPISLEMQIVGETCEECARHCVPNNDKQIAEKNIHTHNVTISTEKLKQLIKENYKYNDYTLQGKIEIVTKLAYFENDKEILEFLRYMEED